MGEDQYSRSRTGQAGGAPGGHLHQKRLDGSHTHTMPGLQADSTGSRPGRGWRGRGLDLWSLTAPHALGHLDFLPRAPGLGGWQRGGVQGNMQASWGQQTRKVTRQCTQEPGASSSPLQSSAFPPLPPGNWGPKLSWFRSSPEAIRDWGPQRQSEGLPQPPAPSTFRSGGAG